MKSEKFNCIYAKQIDLVDYLEKLGHHPAKIRNQDYWYISPLRDEKEPSFKVNRKMNVWYDHGMGKGGNLIEFGKLYHRCTVKEFLMKLKNDTSLIVPFLRRPAGEKKENHGDEGKIIITNEKEISDEALRKYLNERKIPLFIANRYCREVDFELYRKKHTAIGFKNNAGGYELRNAYFKGSNSPKDISLIRGDPREKLSVFEGFFNFLSFQAQQLANRGLLLNLPKLQGNFLILNSLSFFEKSRELMENHLRINLYLDRDASGLRNTEKALKWSERYIDQSIRYKQFKDLNESLINEQEQEMKQSRIMRPRF